MRDDLATGDQLSARTRGQYDPRPASGAMVAKRVRVLCALCGSLLSEVVDFEQRPLVHGIQSGRWVRSGYEAKCATCYGPLEAVIVDADEILSALERARRTGKVVSVRVGRGVTDETALEVNRKHRERHPEVYEQLEASAAEFDAWWARTTDTPPDSSPTAP